MNPEELPYSKDETEENSAESKNLSTAIMANKPLAALICTAMLSSVNEADPVAGLPPEHPAPTDPAIFPWLLCEVFDSESEGRLAWVVAHAAMTIPSVTVVDLLNYAEAGTLEIGVPTRRLQKIAGVLEFLAERAADQVGALVGSGEYAANSSAAASASGQPRNDVLGTVLQGSPRLIQWLLANSSAASASQDGSHVLLLVSAAAAEFGEVGALEALSAVADSLALPYGPAASHQVAAALAAKMGGVMLGCGLHSAIGRWVDWLVGTELRTCGRAQMLRLLQLLRALVVAGGAAEAGPRATRAVPDTLETAFRRLVTAELASRWGELLLLLHCTERSVEGGLLELLQVLPPPRGFLKLRNALRVLIGVLLQDLVDAALADQAASPPSVGVTSAPPAAHASSLEFAQLRVQEAKGGRVEPTGRQEAKGGRVEPASRQEAKGGRVEPAGRQEAEGGREEPAGRQDAEGGRVEPTGRREAKGGREEPAGRQEAEGGRVELAGRQEAKGGCVEPAGRQEAEGGRVEPAGRQEAKGGRVEPAGRQEAKGGRVEPAGRQEAKGGRVEPAGRQEAKGGRVEPAGCQEAHCPPGRHPSQSSAVRLPIPCVDRFGRAVETPETVGSAQNAEAALPSLSLVQANRKRMAPDSGREAGAAAGSRAGGPSAACPSAAAVEGVWLELISLARACLTTCCQRIVTPDAQLVPPQAPAGVVELMREVSGGSTCTSTRAPPAESAAECAAAEESQQPPSAQQEAGATQPGTTWGQLLAEQLKARPPRGPSMRHAEVSDLKEPGPREEQVEDGAGGALPTRAQYEETMPRRPVLSGHRRGVDVMAANPVLVDLLFFLAEASPANAPTCSSLVRLLLADVIGRCHLPGGGSAAGGHKKPHVMTLGAHEPDVMTLGAHEPDVMTLGGQELDVMTLGGQELDVMTLEPHVMTLGGQEPDVLTLVPLLGRAACWDGGTRQNELASQAVAVVQLLRATGWIPISVAVVAEVELDDGVARLAVTLRRNQVELDDGVARL
eukprot:gene4784-5851_t